MEIVAHRRNAIAELDATPTTCGVEVDIRSQGLELVIHHDPFSSGVRFADWIARYRHGLLILNVKEEGLEERVSELVARQGLERWFFLDQSFPFLIRTARRGERRCAVRVSEFESVATALNVAGLIDWVWVDCFTALPIDGEEAEQLRSAGFKLCLVSPELHGRKAEPSIGEMRGAIVERGLRFDAVCTKRPDLWG